MRYILFCGLLCLIPFQVFAQSGYPFMDRARGALTSDLNRIAQWQVTHVIDQTVMQCTSCLKPITVVLRYIADYTKDTDYNSPAALYLAGRRAHCQALVSQGTGRCVSITDNSAASLRPNIGGHSIEGDRLIFEYVMPSNGALLAGYVEGHKDAENLQAIQAVLIEAVRRLHPAW